MKRRKRRRKHTKKQEQTRAQSNIDNVEQGLTPSMNTKLANSERNSSAATELFLTTIERVQ